MEEVTFTFKVPADTAQRIRAKEFNPYLETRNHAGQITSAHPATERQSGDDSHSGQWVKLTQAVATWSKENPVKAVSGSIAAAATISAVSYGLYKLEIRRLRRQKKLEMGELEQTPKALTATPEAEAEALRVEFLAWMTAAEQTNVTGAVVDDLAYAWEEYVDAYDSVHGGTPQLDHDLIALVNKYSDEYQHAHGVPVSSRLVPSDFNDLRAALECQRRVLEVHQSDNNSQGAK
nr:Uncharacterised protein [Streptococcus thermophilus]